jgi:SAM-dependent methyltransferase
MPPPLGAGLTILLLAMAGTPAQQRQAGVHFTPSRHAVADAMLSLAHVTSRDVVYDLGSGDGRIVVIAAQKYGARAVGVEINPQLIELSRQVAREGGVEGRATFLEEDLFAADISEATVVTLYLSPSMNRRLETKLKRELRPGARVVSLQFPIGNWPPDERIRVDAQDLLLWRIR